jgi:hypothetical protein
VLLPGSSKNDINRMNPFPPTRGIKRRKIVSCKKGFFYIFSRTYQRLAGGKMLEPKEPEFLR